MDQNLAINTLFCGQKGLFLTKKAKELACVLLGCENLDTHPDFLIVQEPRALGVEDVEKILAKGAILPCRAEKTVIIVESLDTMSVPGQNKLLKFVEDDNHVILIGTAQSDGTIPTLQSRMRCIQINPYTRCEFSVFLRENNIPDDDVLFYVTGGCPGLLLQEDIQAVVKIFHNAAEAIAGKGSLLKILGLVKEKNNMCFFKKYREYLPQLYHFLAGQLMEKACYSESLYEKIKTIRDHLGICMEQYYTVDCFFEVIAKIMKKEETVKG